MFSLLCRKMITYFYDQNYSDPSIFAKYFILYDDQNQKSHNFDYLIFIYFECEFSKSQIRHFKLRLKLFLLQILA